jgi:K+-transporting ATPase ATPase A chain
VTTIGWLQIALVLSLVVCLAYPLGGSLVELFEGRRTILSPVLAPVERGV